MAVTALSDTIVQAAAKQAGVEFPPLARYGTFTPAQKYIAQLGLQVHQAECLVTEQAEAVASSAARALTTGNSLGAIHGSGPLLDAYVATLVERRSNLVTAMRYLVGGEHS